jgi:hypothetical protein
VVKRPSERKGKLVVSADFLEAVAAAAELTGGTATDSLADAERQGGFMHFENYAEWQKFLLVFDLPPGVPGVVKDAFDRARKLYLLSCGLRSRGGWRAGGADRLRARRPQSLSANRGSAAPSQA